MRLSSSTSRTALHASRSGVALIITVIMLSVITFLAVAFLALSGREKGAVKTATDQTTARLAADAAMVRAQNELLAGMLASRSLANFDLLVSTNFVRWEGYDPAAVDGLTNVNYNHTISGGVLTGNEPLQNLLNLFYSPSPPVFITNKFAPNSVEFRSYLDLNRNGRLDLSGVWRVTNNLNQPLLDNSNRFVTNYVTGDPQWIGATERIELPHSASNKFVYRFAYAAVPIGKTLDINYIHNQARAAASSSMDSNGRDFFRNQGVSPGEINLAAFLYDLNTNSTYGWGLGNIGYFYDPLGSAPIQGNAFADAGALYRYRVNGNPNTLAYGLGQVATLYPFNHFTSDFVDGYSDNPLPMSTNGLGMPASGLVIDYDVPTRPWLGADQQNHFFTAQDLFDANKTDPFGGGYKFTSRLFSAGTNASTYDQYTYYRLLSQLGAESAPDDSDKLNLNYKNVGGYSVTNFVPWTPLDFFTNAANRLLAKYTQDWMDTDFNYYTNVFWTNQSFGISSIPVLISNRFVYTPSVHRLLQMAANIADTKTNLQLPSVFRPLFSRNNTGLYIIGYEEVPTNNPNSYLTAPMEASAVPVGTAPDINVYGVPWVVGAKQGLPNFNEISMHSLFEITRKLQINRGSLTAPRATWHTNLMYVIGVSNAIGVEAWNSYRKDFTNPVVIRVSGDVTMVLTNEFGIPLAISGPLSNSIALFGVTNTGAPNYWRGYGSAAPPDPRSFVIPLRTNIAFLPESVYRSGAHTFTTNLSADFEQGQGFPQPQWGLKASTRLRFVMQLGSVNGPIIDYVQLDNMDGFRQLSEEIRDPDLQTGFDGLWSTNILKNSTLPQGVFNQLDVSLGNAGGAAADWKSYGKGGLAGNDKDFAIDYFRVLYGLSPLKYGGLVNTSVVQQVPFSPTRRVAQHLSWQANDPLVHYTAGDLLNLGKTNNVEKLSLKSPIQLLPNLGVLNDRYSPWGGNPVNESDESVNRYNTAVKDPLVMRSDDWQFPTNVLPNVGWLGRIHRGTPWQTVYLKASDLNIAQYAGPINNLTNWLTTYPDPSSRWGDWSGNPNFMDAYFTRPINDRLIFDVFTTALNENASRGQLSVNQTNLAAWSAVFGGVVTLTNSTSTTLLSRGNQPTFRPMVIEPAGLYNVFDTNTWPPIVRLVAGMNAERERTNAAGGPVHSGGWFKSAGDILSVPQLTDASPYLNLDTNSFSFQRGVNDAAYEWLPQQIMSLVPAGDPRFVIYAYGQALRPAENSIITTGGQFFGLCTNYQITAEVAARAVVRVEGSANPNDKDNANPKRRYPPRLIVESYNYLPPE